jgi:thiamine-phosphate pyrophosphorylase
VRALSNSLASRNSTILCYVTDRRTLALATPSDLLPSLVRKMEATASAGVDWIQIREKDLSAKELAALTREALLRSTSSSEGRADATRILVNDRLDVALTEGAGGLHLGENGLPVAEAKRLVEKHAPREDFLIGVSCHSLEAAKSAAGDGAGYIFFGPVFATPSKAAFGTPQGLGPLAEVCRSIAAPVLAIGGITLDNAAACLAAGARGIAAIRLFQDASNPSAVIAALRRLAL